MHMERRKFWVLALVYTCACAIYMVYLFSQARTVIDENTNNKLYFGALATSSILGEDYHNNITGPESKTEKEDWEAIQKLTRFSNAVGLTFVYTVIMREGEAILVSSSASSEELANDSYVRFYTPYPDASQALRDSFSRRDPAWVDYEDRWGEFRAVFVPLTSADGSVYVAGAEVSLDYYRQQLRNEALNLVGLAILLFAAFSLLVAFYLLMVRRYIQQLHAKEDALTSAKESAEKASAAKGEFLAVMSHEIRTPLNGIVGAVELLQTSLVSPKQNEYLSLIKSNSESLQVIIDDILDLSKIEVGKMELELSVIDFRSVIDSTLEMLRPNLQGKMIKLSRYIDSNVPDFVSVDVQRLRQVLINLLGNAIKFTQRGEISVQVSLISAGDDGSTELQVVVKDTGIGIDMADLTELFAPFTQADTSTTRRYGGAGLGLSICKRLVELMGGAIGARSTLGEGSEFYFTLRCQAVAQPETSKDIAIAQKQIQSIDECHEAPLKILLVEDNVTNQIITQVMLKNLGQSVVTVENGEKALELCETEAFDVILMDIQMPGMDGVNVARTIRQMGLSKQPYIVAFTANVLLEDRERYKQAGMNDFLAKPVRIAALSEVLVRAARAAQPIQKEPIAE